MIEDVNRTDFYETVYNKLYAIGYHADPHYSHSYGLIEYLLKECEFNTILDVGASIGAAVEKLKYSGKSVLGIEVSFEAATRANQFGRPVLWGSATKLPFVNNYCDVVMSTDMMEHLRREDVGQAIAEMCRVASKYTAHKICSRPEGAGWGKRVGVPDLHLTQKPIQWWIDEFLVHGGEVKFHQGDTFVIDYTGEKDE